MPEKNDRTYPANNRNRALLAKLFEVVPSLSLDGNGSERDDIALFATICSWNLNWIKHWANSFASFKLREIRSNADQCINLALKLQPFWLTSWAKVKSPFHCRLRGKGWAGRRRKKARRVGLRSHLHCDIMAGDISELSFVQHTTGPLKAWPVKSEIRAVKIRLIRIICSTPCFSRSIRETPQCGRCRWLGRTWPWNGPNQRFRRWCDQFVQHLLGLTHHASQDTPGTR